MNVDIISSATYSNDVRVCLWQYRIILSAILRNKFFRQTIQKAESILWCNHLERERFKW